MARSKDSDLELCGALGEAFPKVRTQVDPSLNLFLLPRGVISPTYNGHCMLRLLAEKVREFGSATIFSVHTVGQCLVKVKNQSALLPGLLRGRQINEFQLGHGLLNNAVLELIQVEERLNCLVKLQLMNGLTNIPHLFFSDECLSGAFCNLRQLAQILLAL